MSQCSAPPKQDYWLRFMSVSCCFRTPRLFNIHHFIKLLFLSYMCASCVKHITKLKWEILFLHHGGWNQKSCKTQPLVLFNQLLFQYELKRNAVLISIYNHSFSNISDLEATLQKKQFSHLILSEAEWEKKYLLMLYLTSSLHTWSIALTLQLGADVLCANRWTWSGCFTLTTCPHWTPSAKVSIFCQVCIKTGWRCACVRGEGGGLCIGWCQS